MAKIQIKSETRHELSFFPNSFDDYVPKDSKVRMVDRIVRSMDINPLMDTYDGTGAPPYSPMIPQFGITECLIRYKCSVNTPPPHSIRSG